VATTKTKTKTPKTKQQTLEEAVAEAVGAGRELYLETVDFSDANRPKTCLEVDFPILPINHVATIEGNAGKPIYQMSKWWARRRSSVFRAMLIAAATKAPDDPGEAAKTVWDAYYANHQKNPKFKRLKVADIFMGGGTTVVEGARLGMQMYGNDLNPIAWFVTKNELAQVDPKEVEKLLNEIEAEVKPQIMPFYACDCPRGHKGKWKKIATGKVMGDSFDPLALTPAERPQYEYEGPEVIYTFWAKHGPCQATECNHRTPIMSTPVVAVKTLTVKAWPDWECTKCGESFDIEQQEARMAPAALFVVASDEKPHAVMSDTGRYECPHCHHKFRDEVAASDGKSASLGKAKNKSVELTLLVHPDWLKGSSGHDAHGKPFGGSVTDSAEATAAWNDERAKALRLIEVRGTLPEEVTCPDTEETFFTDSRGGTVPKKSTFTCKEGTCGKDEDVLTAIKASGKSGPVSEYAIQGYCPECDQERRPYSGRFFDVPDVREYDAANREWQARRENDLASYWPRSELPFGFMTHMNNGGIPNHGYTHWWTMFNPRQLFVHAHLLRSVVLAGNADWQIREYVLGSFQQYLRNQSMLAIWHLSHDHFAPALSNNNFHPKATMIEVGVFTPVGYGPWPSTLGTLTEASEWSRNPWEIVPKVTVTDVEPDLAEQITGKSVRVYPDDAVNASCDLDCRSSTDLRALADQSFDLMITDPPFGGLLHYSELADYFYVWLRLVLNAKYPELFSAEYTPKALEAVANRARHPDDADAFYQKLLTECWREAKRILKPGGVLAFTFHHSEDEPWVAVLESLFEAGFYLEAAYPIRSDETKGEGGKPGTFGSQLIEYDIIHVCRKRTDEPQPMSWAKMRRQIMQDVRQLQEILEQHQTAGLQEADLGVIRRGKALEYFSKHYGKVYIERDRDFTVREALVGINQLLDDEKDTGAEMPPVLAEPYTRQFLRLFADGTSMSRDQMHKYLRGTGVSPTEFVERGWCSESQKVFHVASPLELARNWKGLPRNSMSRDFDQTMFLVGACYENSGIRVYDTLNSPSFNPHPATADLLDWLTRHGGSAEIKNAARLGKQLYNAWLAKNKPKVELQRGLFDLDDSES